MEKSLGVLDGRDRPGLTVEKANALLKRYRKLADEL